VSPLAYAGSGVDTVSIAFRPKREGALEAFRRTAHRDGAAGVLVANERGADGGRVMCWPGFGVIALETRLGALLAGDAENHALAPARAIKQAAPTARLVINDVIGSDPGEHAEVRRFDLASELYGDESWEGLALLRTLAGMCPPRSQVTVHYADDHTPMTVYHRTAKRGVVQDRAYDKGRESGSDPPGRRIRLESQNRPKKAERYTPEVLAKLDLAPIFGRTMSHYLQEQEVVAAGPDAALTHLVGKATRGELSLAKAERLVGVVAIMRYAGRTAYQDEGSSARVNNNRSARRLRALREAGISLDDNLPPEATVPVGQLLTQAIDSFTA
jgi:hypothetical protein